MIPFFIGLFSSESPKDAGLPNFATPPIPDHLSPMNKKALPPLALILVAASLVGCSHQKSQTGSRSSYGMGLVEIERGAYQPAGSVSVDINTNENFGDSGKVSGVQTKVLWGLFTFNDY